MITIFRRQKLAAALLLAAFMMLNSCILEGSFNELFGSKSSGSSASGGSSSSSVPNSASNCMVGEWLMHGSANDTSGFGRDGTVYNAVLTNGPMGTPNTAYYFNGVNAYIHMPFQMYPRMSVSFWAKVISVYDQCCLVEIREPFANTGFYCAAASANDANGVFRMNNGVETPPWMFYNVTNVWIHYVFVCDGTNYYAYTNALLIRQTNLNRDIFTNQVFNNMYIGKNNYVGSYYTGMLFSDLRIYNCGLSSNEVKALYDLVAVLTTNFTTNFTTNNLGVYFTNVAYFTMSGGNPPLWFSNYAVSNGYTWYAASRIIICNINSTVLYSVTNTGYFTNGISVTNLSGYVPVNFTVNSVVTNTLSTVTTNFESRTFGGSNRLVYNNLVTNQVVAISNALTNGVLIYQNTNSNIYCGGASLTNWVPVVNGLVGEWLMQGNANDTSGLCRNGTAYNAVLTNVPFGPSNTAYYFNGVNAYMNMPFQMYPQMSISFWAKVLTCYNECCLVEIREPFANTGFYCAAASANDANGVFRMNNGVETPPWMFYNVTNVWIHYVFVCDGTNYYAYTNALLIRQTNLNREIFTNQVFNNMYIGKNNYIGTYYTEMLFGGLRIYNRGLSPDEVTNLFYENSNIIKY